MRKLEDRNALIERARELMDNLSLNAFDAIVEAENEFEEQMKNEGEENE